MTIWIIFATMTAAVISALAVPLRRTQGVAPLRTEYDQAVFRDQLAELDRDEARGLIGATEAEAARNEISRRLLQAAKTVQWVPPAPHSAALPIIALLIVPAVALPLYLNEGSPGLPDTPRAARLAKAQETGDFPALIARVEDHLAENPDDLQGWQVIAPAYKRSERWSDAAGAYGNILRLSSPTADTLSDYAEMLVFAGQGMVPPEARDTFHKAMLLDPKSPRPRFFLALAAKQDGNLEAAKAGFASLLADAEPDAPYRPMVEAELKDITSRPPALTAEQQQAGASMSGEDQQAMIRTMVDGLETKLQADGNNLDGWLRLIRARTVLQEDYKARAALAAARAQFKGQPEANAALDGLAKELNLL